VSTISNINLNLKAGRGCPTLKSLNKVLLTTRNFCVKQDGKSVCTNESCVRVCLVVMTCVLSVHIATGHSGRAPFIVVVTETFTRTVWNSDQSVARHLLDQTNRRQTYIDAPHWESKLQSPFSDLDDITCVSGH
jgi:hypothetical protein